MINNKSRDGPSLFGKIEKLVSLVLAFLLFIALFSFVSSMGSDTNNENDLPANPEDSTEDICFNHDYSGENPFICVNNCGIYNLPKDGSVITIQEALWVAETLQPGMETSERYIVSGTIYDEDNPSNTKGATTITSNGNNIYITEIYSADGEIKYGQFVHKFKNGEFITVSAIVAQNSSGEAQLHKTRIASHLVTLHTTCENGGYCDICGLEIEPPLEHNDSNDDLICDDCGTFLDASLNP